MKIWLACLLLLPALSVSAAPDIPEPAELEPDIRFWMRVYSEISTNEGFIHDQRDLSVVYQTLHFDPTLPPRERERLVGDAREHYQAILRRLGSGVAPQTDDEQRVSGLWPGASTERLTQAADDVRFQLGQSDRFRAGLQRAGAWESHISQTLSREGLPPEIAALPHVESSFQPSAMSKAGAAGLWQFIRSTGRRYLRIDRAVDERLDPYRSTEAAAQLLSYNYRLLGSWPLAITAYNHGAGGMRRARDQVGSDDIVQIVRHYHSPSFGFASRNYYASFVAALRLDRDQARYFGALKREPEASSQEVALDAPVRADTLAGVLKLSRDRLRELNPALRATVWSLQQPVPRGYRLRLPAGLEGWSGQGLAARLTAALRTPLLAAESVATNKAAAIEAPVAGTATAKTARAQQPRGQAARGQAALAAVVPGSGPRSRAVLSAAELAAAANAYSVSYIVREGDTLATIAVQTGIEPESLMRSNRLSDGDHIYEGQVLTLATGNEHAAADELLATQALEDERVDEAVAAQARARSGPILNAAEAQEQGPALLTDVAAPASADPIDYSVQPDGSLIVVAAETIGHYADWLAVSTSSLRGLNGMRGRSNVRMGRHFKLSFAHVTRAQFEQRRIEYHRRLQTEYFSTHRITGSDTYVARRGDSLWSMTQRGALPIWLLQQYNPDVAFDDLRPGTQIVLPRVEDAS
jgi:membrane-bound lytic murein transglycosylase D